MTEPTGPRGRRRSSRHSGGSDRSRWTSRGRRSLVGVAVVLVIVGAAVGLSIALSGAGPAPASSASQPGDGSGLALETGPILDASFPPVAGLPSPIPGSSPGLGIRAIRIQVVRLGIDLPIVDGDGIDAPIGKAAHYPGSGWPDGGTNIYIYGHARVGMFLNLWNVAVGDQVVLTLVDGTLRTYSVATIIPKVPWNALSYLAPTPTEQLTLQTSTSYHATSPRFIAIAYPTP